ncbi:18148_t:CDS:2 [Dentiscutata erythropus]|uniref:18148_t:CDS:1 n=1 Tax=Dentiscutata erythropus TaxID=1348616 RepID=A0A9N9NA47_9GLOM|nr:18148_t:CDS:2 [Dentiscutata erythropus]
MVASAKYDYETYTQLNCQFREKNDGGIDLEVEICTFEIGMQCKAYFNQYIDHIDAFKTIVRERGYDIGVFVGFLEKRISLGAYISATKSDRIIVTTYKRMCRDVLDFIFNLLNQESRALEDKCKL